MRTARLQRMAERVAHRGPDDSGFWVHPRLNVNLGFRRLAILDLTPSGHQPMQSNDGRFTIIFNGEIYNYRDVRNELLARGHSFRGHSDTEVMLAAFSEWGISAAIRKFAGMFAIAVWDEQEHELSLVRDRFGKKPLYYGWQNGTLLFASELKAFAGDPDFQGRLNPDVLASYLALSYVPSPNSIFVGISKLESATILRIPFAEGEESKENYWDYRTHFSSTPEDRLRPEEVQAGTQQLLDTCVAERMVADVPIGAFLSGGIDSSLIVATMQKLSPVPVKTFTIGFREERYDEASYARAVAAHLGTDHHELYVTPLEAQTALERMSAIYDEPFADSSQLPTYLVARLARERVTVVLTGDGGDEIFGGYNRYLVGERLHTLFSLVPHALRKAFSRALASPSPESWDAVVPARFAQTFNGDRIHKLASLLEAPTTVEAYKNLLGYRQAVNLLSERNNAAFSGVFRRDVTFDPALPVIANMMLLDASTYLMDDILAKVDRATMAVSLEARCPFLDHRLAEWAGALPLRYKVNGGRGKLLLHQLLAGYLPARLIERPKMGFGIPLAAWLRGPLRAWSEDVLRGLDGAAGSLFDRAEVLRLWSEHQGGVRNWQVMLWNMLVLLTWLEDWKAAPGQPHRQCELVPSGN